MATAFSPTSFPDSARVRSTAESAVPAGRLIAFSSIMLPMTAAQVPIGVYVPALYAQHFGLSLAVLGVIFLAERVWGTLADPIIGVLSDRTRSRLGRRKVWIVGGSALYAVAALFLFFPFMPFVRVTPLYLGVTLFAFYLAWSMVQIPYLAWSGEISGEYHERTRIATYQGVTAAISLLAVMLLPTLVDQISPKNANLKLGSMGGVILLSLVPALVLTLRSFREPPVPVGISARPSFATTLRLVASEGPLLRVLLSDFAVTTGQSIRGALIVFFVTYYMGLPKWASGLYLLQFVFGIVAAPIWAGIARRHGKHRTAIAGELAQAAINLGLLLVVPGELGLLLALTVAQGLTQSSGNLMLRSMVADVADRHRLETGVDRTALFFSVFSISAKAGMAAAVGIALPLVAWLGFSPAAHVNTPGALRGLVLVFALGPALAHIVSATLLRGFPIDEARHAEIRRDLDAKAAACNTEPVWSEFQPFPYS